MEASKALQAALSHASSVELSGQGHQAHLTATDEFVAAVDAFLRIPAGTDFENDR
jgi:pimeloyl-ACP methyl ester carboxylesterase